MEKDFQLLKKIIQIFLDCCKKRLISHDFGKQKQTRKKKKKKPLNMENPVCWVCKTGYTFFVVLLWLIRVGLSV